MVAISLYLSTDSYYRCVIFFFHMVRITQPSVFLKLRLATDSCSGGSLWSGRSVPGALLMLTLPADMVQAMRRQEEAPEVGWGKKPPDLLLPQHEWCVAETQLLPTANKSPALFGEAQPWGQGTANRVR